MADFTLFYCHEETKNKVIERNIFKYFLIKVRSCFETLIGLLMPHKAEVSFNKVEICKDVNAYLSELPCKLEKLTNPDSRTIKRIEKHIFDFCTVNNIKNYLLPAKLSEVKELQEILKRGFTGKGLYESLTLNILKKLYSKRDIVTGSLDIVIVDGKEGRELCEVIMAISKQVKYITVITDEKEKVEDSINEIYAETGIAVRVTKDFRSGLKGADFIINLGGLKELVVNSCVNQKAIILNYTDMNLDKVLCENIFISGIDIDLPEVLVGAIGKDILEQYNKLDVAEIALSSKIRTGYIYEEGLKDFGLSEKMSMEFEREGYKIAGFQGRRGALKEHDFRICSDSS